MRNKNLLIWSRKMSGVFPGKLANRVGFSLPELLVAFFIVVIAFLGIMLGFMKSLELVETSRNATNAMIASKSRLETIKNTPFNQLVTNYDVITFTDPLLNGIGVSYINDSVADIYVVTISFCWRQKNGAVVGEDKNLNGVLDAGEDQNGNGIIDSIVEIVSAIYDQ